jgi:hypothetical protein
MNRLGYVCVKCDDRPLRHAELPRDRVDPQPRRTAGAHLVASGWRRAVRPRSLARGASRSVTVSLVNGSRSVLRASAVAMIVALVLFPAVTRLRQIGVPQNPASFSGVHRSGVMPSGPELVVPEDAEYRVRPEPVVHPADHLDVRNETLVTAVLDTSGLRAPPTALA